MLLPRSATSVFSSVGKTSLGLILMFSASLLPNSTVLSNCVFFTVPPSMVRMVMVLEGDVKPLAIQAATALASLGSITTSPMGFGGFELSSFVNGLPFLILYKNN